MPLVNANRPPVEAAAISHRLAGWLAIWKFLHAWLKVGWKTHGFERIMFWTRSPVLFRVFLIQTERKAASVDRQNQTWTCMDTKLTGTAKVLRIQAIVVSCSQMQRH